MNNTPPNNYCSSEGTDASYEYIDSVIIGTINNGSGSNNGYGDYTNLSTAVGMGDTLNLSVSLVKAVPTDDEYITVFIDYNRDGFFNVANETAYSASGSDSSFIGSITIPGTATIGLTRMRVSLKYSEPALPCETYEFGEVEDYLLNITLPLRTSNEMDETATVALILAPNPASTNIQVTLDAEDANYELQIYSITGQLMKQLSFSGTTTNVDINDLPNGVYQLSVTSNENHLNKMFVKQ